MSGTYTPAEGKGTIFKNDRKTADNHPDWKGTAMVNGALVDIALWSRDNAKGPFFSVGISPARERTAQPAPRQDAAPRGRGGAVDEDAIPFAACKE